MAFPLIVIQQAAALLTRSGAAAALKNMALRLLNKLGSILGNYEIQSVVFL